MKTNTQISYSAGIQIVTDLIAALATAKSYFPEKAEEIDGLLEKLNTFSVSKDEIVAARAIVYDSFMIQCANIMKGAEHLVALKKDYDRSEKEIIQSLDQIEEIMQNLRSGSQATQLQKEIHKKK